MPVSRVKEHDCRLLPTFVKCSTLLNLSLLYINSGKEQNPYLLTCCHKAEVRGVISGFTAKKVR